MTSLSQLNLREINFTMAALNLDQNVFAHSYVCIGGNNSTDLDGIFEEKQYK